MFSKKLAVSLSLSVALVTNVAMANTIVSQGLGISSYTASSTYLGNNPSLAFDGNTSTAWISNNFPLGWVEVNLGQLTDISQLLLTVNQQPSPSNTIHEIWTSSSSIGWNTSSASLAFTFSGNTYNGQLLSTSFSNPLSAQYVQVRTTSSPSWVAWNEIQVLSPDKIISSVPEPETYAMLLAGLGLLGFTARHRKNNIA